MHDPVALVTIPSFPRLPVRISGEPIAPRSLALYGFGAAALLALGFLSTGLPALVMCMFAVSGMSSVVLAAALGAAKDGDWGRRPGCVSADTIVAGEVQASYRAILDTLTDVEDAIAAAPRLGGSLAPVIERCRGAAALSGRIALLANPIQRYLDLHDAGLMRQALDRLRARAEAATDQVAISAWSHAAAARVRQLAIVEQIQAKRDQICARLGLVHATLETFAAEIIRLQALDDEQVALAGESLTEQLDEIGGDLEVLEVALDPELAA